MGDRPGEAFFRDLEARRLRSLVEVDLEVARELHSADYELITPGGATYSRDEYLGDLASGAIRYEVFEAASPIAVRIFGDAAAVRYHARIRISFPGGHDDATFWHTDIYEHRDGRWQAVWSQATVVPRGEA